MDSLLIILLILHVALMVFEVLAIQWAADFKLRENPARMLSRQWNRNYLKAVLLALFVPEILLVLVLVRIARHGLEGASRD